MTDETHFLITTTSNSFFSAEGMLIIRLKLFDQTLPESVMETSKVALTLSLWMKSYAVTIQMKPLQQYSHMVLFRIKYFTKLNLGFVLNLILGTLGSRRVKTKSLSLRCTSFQRPCYFDETRGSITKWTSPQNCVLSIINY